jgi:hypothetical protein
VPRTEPDDFLPTRRRLALERGTQEGWGWIFESQNPAGHVDDFGTTYDEPTYTLVFQDRDGEYEVTVPASMIDGIILHGAWSFGGGKLVEELGYPIRAIEYDESESDSDEQDDAGKQTA